MLIAGDREKRSRGRAVGLDRVPRWPRRRSRSPRPSSSAPKPAQRAPAASRAACSRRRRSRPRPPPGPASRARRASAQQPAAHHRVLHAVRRCTGTSCSWRRRRARGSWLGHVPAGVRGVSVCWIPQVTMPPLDVDLHEQTRCSDAVRRAHHLSCDQRLAFPRCDLAGHQAVVAGEGLAVGEVAQSDRGSET